MRPTLFSLVRVKRLTIRTFISFLVRPYYNGARRREKVGAVNLLKKVD